MIYIKINKATSTLHDNQLSQVIGGSGIIDKMKEWRKNNPKKFIALVVIGGSVVTILALFVMGYVIGIVVD